jgi:hypothetical protein
METDIRMERPGIVNGGDGLQIWRAVENIFNKKSRQPARGVPPCLGLSEWLSTPHFQIRLLQM